MTSLNKIFTHTKEDPFKIKQNDFFLNANIKSKYITINILSYAFLKETAYRVLASLNYDSFCFLKENRP